MRVGERFASIYSPSHNRKIMTNILFRDDNYVPLQDKDGIVVTKTMCFSNTGVGTTYLFTVTNPCIAKVIGYCSGSLTESGASATVEVGLIGSTGTIIAQTLGTLIDSGEFWIDATPDISGSDPTAKLVNADIIQTVGTGTVSAGTITYYCLFRPLTATSTIVAA